MITNLRTTIWGRLKDLANAKVVQLCATGVPTIATGRLIAGRGSLYTDITAGDLYINKGTITVPNWQKANVVTAEILSQTDSRDVATTGITDFYIFADANGRLARAFIVTASPLPAHMTNFVTFYMTNLGKDGSANNPMLAAIDANTTKTLPLVAGVPRSLELHTTGDNLLVERYDRIRIRVAVNGTLPNIITGAQFALDVVG